MKQHIDGLVSVYVYETESGQFPFEDWLNALPNRRAQQIVDAHLTRLSGGNFGDCKSLGAGVSELRIHDGPGYRIYFGKDGDSFVILIGGGEEKTQQNDIRKAKIIWQEYKRRKALGRC